jgi:hypothetical protein
MQERAGCEGGGKGALIQTDKSASLRCGNWQTLFQPITYSKSKRAQTPTDYETWKESDKANTMNCFDQGDVRATDVVVEKSVFEWHNQDSRIRPIDVGCTLNTNAGGREGHLVLETEKSVIAFDRSAYNQGKNAKFDIGIDENGIAHSLVAKGPGGVCYAVDMGGGKSSCNVKEGLTPTLTCTHGGEPAVCYCDTSHADDVVRVDDKVAPLQARDYKGGKMICYGIDPSASRDVGALFIEEKSKTITNGSCPGHHNGVVVKSVDCRNGTEADINGALQSNSAHSLNGNNVVRVRYIVRRLTPLECERLQGFPDGWTDIGEYINSKGKKCKTSDAARYKALGNSIALPSWRWVLKRISACYERTPIMASLFDGIGGFPKLWEDLNGKGTCIWSSEIDDFPDAVTKKRIGG